MSEVPEYYRELVKGFAEKLNSPDTVLNSTLNEEYPVCPVHECEGEILRYTFSIVPYTDKKTGEPRSFSRLNVQFRLLSAIATEAKGDNPTSYMSVPVDVNDKGELDTENPQANVKLGRFLATLGMNRPGAPLQGMIGKTRRIRVDNVTDETESGVVVSDYVSTIYGETLEGKPVVYRNVRTGRKPQ